MITVKNGLVDLHTGDIPDGNWLTVREFAKRHRVSEGAVRVWVQRNQVENKTFCRQIYIRENTKIKVRPKRGQQRVCDKKV